MQWLCWFSCKRHKKFVRLSHLSGNAFKCILFDVNVRLYNEILIFILFNVGTASASRLFNESLAKVSMNAQQGGTTDIGECNKPLVFR